MILLAGVYQDGGQIENSLLFPRSDPPVSRILTSQLNLSKSWNQKYSLTLF